MFSYVRDFGQEKTKYQEDVLDKMLVACSKAVTTLLFLRGVLSLG